MSLRFGLASLLILVGCGSDDDGLDSEDNTTEESSPDASVASTPDNDEDESGPAMSTAGPVAAVGYNDCVAIVVAYGQLDGMLQGGSTTNLPSVSRELSTRLPEGLQDEFAVVAAGVAGAEDAKLLDAPSTATPEFSAAVGRIARYTTTECAASDG